jgi:hypothetical protein
LRNRLERHQHGVKEGWLPPSHPNVNRYPSADDARTRGGSSNRLVFINFFR